jgi:hypothetical protein
MGYAKVFWIREEPIRHYLATNGRNDSVAEEVGKRVLAIAVHDSFQEEDEPEHSLPFFETPSVFFPFQSFHSTDFAMLFWTGSRLVAIGPSLGMFDSLCDLAKTAGMRHMHRSISREEYYHAIGGGGWRNELDESRCICASVFWIYEDVTRHLEREPETNWPCREVGAAVLNLMLSNWSGSERLGGCGNAVSRCCSFSQPECAVLIWLGNCLRPLVEIESDEIQHIRQWLGRE